MTDPDTSSTYRHVFTVPERATDGNGHVNNVVYVQWMQDVAILHFEALGGESVMKVLGATWFARSHRVEYLKPAFAGEEVTALTWIEDVQRVRSVRRYQFLRERDQALLAEGETHWVFVDAASGRPRKIPEAITRLLPVVGED
jgi:acyl-CoA thioester hydrolase